MGLAALDLDAAHQLLQPAALVDVPVQRRQTQDHADGNTGHAVRHGKIQAGRGKQQKQHIKQRVSRPQRIVKSVFQIPVPLFGRKYTG